MGNFQIALYIGKGIRKFCPPVAKNEGTNRSYAGEWPPRSVLCAHALSGFGAGPDSSLLKTSKWQGILSSCQKVPEASGRTHMTPIGYLWLSWRFLVFVVELVEMHPKEQGSGNDKVPLKISMNKAVFIV